MRTICFAWLLVFSPALRSSTFVLGHDTNQIFGNENVGPYSGTLTGSSAVGFFCLDDTLTATFGVSYYGTVAVPTTQQEKEAAFLASYSRYLGAPSSDPGFVNSVEGPISFAIWQIMGTLGNTPPDPAAQPFIQTAQYAYSHNLIPQSFLNTVLIFSPSTPGIQRFITAVPDNAVVSAELSAQSAGVPEPVTWVLVATCLALGVGWRLRRHLPLPAGRSPAASTAARQ